MKSSLEDSPATALMMTAEAASAAAAIIVIVVMTVGRRISTDTFQFLSMCMVINVVHQRCS